MGLSLGLCKEDPLVPLHQSCWNRFGFQLVPVKGNFTSTAYNKL